MFVALWLALTAPASAEADIEFKTSAPVLIYVDGEAATLTGKLKQRVADLEPGTHAIKVTGVFGKTLYEAEIELPDDTITQAEWIGGELRVLSTDWRDGEPSDEAGDAPADEGAGDGAELPLAIPQPEVAAEPLAEPPAAAPPAAEPPAERAVALPAPVLLPKTLTVQAQPGMRVEVVHGGQTVVVIVEAGGFRIEDPSGVQMQLSASR